jgi:hypothetical protein
MAVSGIEDAYRLDKVLSIPAIPSLIKRASLHTTSTGRLIYQPNPEVDSKKSTTPKLA